MNNPEKLWTKNFILVSLVNFQLVLTFYLLVIVIVGYSVAELNASKAQAGLISGLFIVGTLFGRFIVGRLLDVIGPRKTLILGLFGFLVLSGFYFLKLDIMQLLFVRFAHGFMMGLASTVLGTIIAQIIPSTRRGEGIGYYSLSSTIGTAIGPFVAIWLLLYVDYDVIFYFSSLIACCCLIVGFNIQIPGIKTTNQQKPVYENWISQFIEPKALPIAIVVLLTSLCYAGVLSFVTLYAQTIGLVQAATMFFLVYALSILVSRPFTGPLLDRKGPHIIMFPAFMIMAIGLVLLSYASNAWMLLLSAGLLGLGYGNIQSVCQTLAITSVPVERMGYATSTFFIFLDAGLGIGPFFLGLFLAYIQYQEMYLYSAILVIVTMAVYPILYRTKQRTAE